MSSGFANIPKDRAVRRRTRSSCSIAWSARRARRSAPGSAGFLAGVESAPAAAQPAAPARPAEPLTIVFASESGNCGTARRRHCQGGAQERPQADSLIDMADLDLAALPASRQELVVIAATWGEGEPPARAVRAYAS